MRCIEAIPSPPPMRTPLSFVLAAIALHLACPAVALALDATATTVPALASPTLHSDITELKFRDFFRMPVSSRGLEPTPTLLAHNGRKVRLTGFMVAREDAQAGSFLLTPMPVRMSEHADGDANDLPLSTVLVIMPHADQHRPLLHQDAPMQLTGVLEWGRQEMSDGSVNWLRLRLDPRATDTPTPLLK